MYGLDTGYLVAAEVREHPDHSRTRAQLEQLIAQGAILVLAPQVLLEFIHVVTDPRRFATPLSVETARMLAHNWWTAAEVRHAFPDAEAIEKFFEWHSHFRLGRKRLLDTLLAATYWRASARSILTTNPADFTAVGAFTCITPEIKIDQP